MAKVIEKFGCEVCGSEYDKKGDAEDCEKHHAVPEKVHSAEFNPRIEYPNKVVIRFKNGQTRKYRME
jgi:predicted ATP-dependent serine protease